MEKLIYLLGEAPPGTIPQGRKDLREALLAAVGPLRAAGAKQVAFSVADVDDPDVERVTQLNAAGLLDARLSLWVDHHDDLSALEAIIRPLAPRIAGYLVTESILRDYEVGPSRGEPGPGIALVTTFPKPDGIDDETFFARWHDSHGPLSLELHPLTRYERNSVFRALTPNAPSLRAIVSESVASAAIAADPEVFYGGRENRRRIVRDLLSFAEVDTMSTVAMREVFC